MHVIRVTLRSAGALLSRSLRSLRQFLGTIVVLLLTGAVMVAPAHSVQPDEVLPDAGLEARARHISSGLRCVVCQNQSIDDSNAPLARDLRILVRERLKAGDSDEAAIGYIVQRYGDFVLLRPPLNIETILLWLAPLLLLAGAGVLAFKQFRSPARTSAPSNDEAPLSPDEARKLDDILNRRG
jgi:cytochrome c-type biogenesis protein CcmH